MELKGDIVKINEISQSEIEEMYILMTEFYNNVDKNIFLKDLKEKDYCLINFFLLFIKNFIQIIRLKLLRNLKI